MTYATPDGRWYFRKERALTSYSDHRETPAALDADPDNLGAVADEATRDRYATQASDMADRNDPDDAV